MSGEPAATAEVVESSAEMATVADGVSLDQPMVPPGVQPSVNYLKAVEIGHVLAASGFYPDAREPAKAAVKVMIAMDLGLAPTAALQGIHTIEKDGKISFLIESKLFGAVIGQRPGYDVQIVERTIDNCTLRFLRNGKPVNSGEGLSGPDISFSMADAKRAGLTDRGQKMYGKYPEEMLYWRCLAKGVRIHFPELLAGQPVYIAEEMGVEEESLKGALEPGRPAPLGDDKAEELRSKAKSVYDEIKEIAPERLPPGRYANMIGKAEHSHSQLESVVETLEALRDSEKEIASLSDELEKLLTKDEHKAVMGRAERRGSNAERIELLNSALEEAKKIGNGAEDGDAPADDEKGGD